VGRDADRGVEVVEELDRVGAGGEFLSFDLLDLGDIRRLAREVTERYRHLDMLLNSAGGTFRAKALTPDGIERTFAFNTIAPYASLPRYSPPSKRARGGW
jgi:NAD(P)-dependent dehydrogenase (short-subunit alcohol dehydrogenase family)